MNPDQYLLKNEFYMKVLMWTSIVAAGLSAYISFVLAQQKDSSYYFGLLLTLPLGACVIYFRNKMLKFRSLYFIKSSWGKTQERKRKFNDITRLHDYLILNDEDNFHIDDQTWQDLTMDKVYAEIDRTLSTPGEQMLYSILRTLSFNDEVLDKRKEFIKLFESDKVLREKIQIELYALSRQTNNTITDFLWGDLPSKSKLSILFKIMAFLPIFFVLLMPIFGLQVGVYIIFVFMVNMYIHYKFRKEISIHIDSMAYLSSIINTAKNICKIEDVRVKSYSDVLVERLKTLKACKSAGFLSSIEGIDFITDYVNILFLNKERKFFSVLDEMLKYSDKIREIYTIIGELDALISISSYRASVNNYSEPEFIYGKRCLDVMNAVHPLVKDPVANSVTIIEQGIILTGSNMSGKSTFLRTIGINALFAQTICTCLADSYKASHFKVLSSISPSDNLLIGKSYYLGEAEAILRIINSCTDVIPSLCIIDEIFRGTNPIERIGASAEILGYLINNNCAPIVATHDLELTEIVDKAYQCWYFTEDVTEEGLRFDYLIRKGVSPTRNAIKLLKYIGYPDEIIKRTYERVDSIVSK